MTCILVYLVILGIIVFMILKRPKRYIEPLPRDMDPKGPEARPFWHRAPQNRRRFAIGCGGYLVVALLVLGAHWWTSNYTVQSIQDATPTVTVVESE